MSKTVKDRTKTSLGRAIEKALISLNDQYIFFLFAESHFFTQLDRTASAFGGKFTTEVFQTNPYASKIHVRVRDLHSFGVAHRSATFGAYFTTSYEIARPFTTQVLQAVQRFSRTSLVLPPRGTEAPEQFYQRILSSWGLARPDDELTDTLSFMRHRRNSLVHLNNTPPPSYRTLVGQSGRQLNAFWKRARVQIDFTIAETKPLEERETLDLLKLLRITVQRLDTHFASVIDRRGLAQSEARRLFSTETGRINMERRIKALRTEILRKYSLSLVENDLRSAAQSVGTT